MGRLGQPVRGGGMTIVHDFGESLQRSQRAESEPFWRETYERAFPTLVSMVSVRKDGWAQRAGIDRQLTLACGRIVRVDEKVREKAWGDILLERWADFERKQEGWIVKPLLCDYLGYGILPLCLCYLFPMLELQRAWRNEGQDWARKAKAKEAGFEIRKAFNQDRISGRKWTTINIAIPTNEIFRAVRDAITINLAASP
jgi:hypothetical protein